MHGSVFCDTRNCQDNIFRLLLLQHCDIVIKDTNPYANANSIVLDNDTLQHVLGGLKVSRQETGMLTISGLRKQFFGVTTLREVVKSVSDTATHVVQTK